MSKLIPFEHDAVFRLDGVLGKRHQALVQVSSDGPFVAESLSYALDTFTNTRSDTCLPSLFAMESTCCQFVAETIRFLFAITDTASGRQLQNELLHNMAVLGPPGADRARKFARPWRLAPRSELRLEVEEIFSIQHLDAANVFQGPELAAFLDSFRTGLGSGVPVPANAREVIEAGEDGERRKAILIEIDLHLTFHGYKVLP